MAVEPEGEISRLRRRYTDRLITLLAVLLALEIFVVAPFHAVGIFGSQGFAIVASLGVIAVIIVAPRGTRHHVDLLCGKCRHPMARSLCNIESIIGQLYPATLLARLVTLELSQGSR